LNILPGRSFLSIILHYPESAGPAHKIESFQRGDFSAHVYGDAAIVSTTAAIKGKFKGTDIPAARSIGFFVKRDGRWQTISTQNTIITP